jgi:hypothetical protein
LTDDSDIDSRCRESKDGRNPQHTTAFPVIPVDFAESAFNDQHPKPFV